MKSKEMRELSTEQLKELAKTMRFELMKSRATFGTAKIKTKEMKIKVEKKGIKTSLQKDIRRNIARALTILKER